ncbi:hypothetical protein SAMN06295888_11931 [Desulfonatronum zhilinae]|nr:hypothetical protein SAMN06295888_11931 [Desulfonatronum zhilinae]
MLCITRDYVIFLDMRFDFDRDFDFDADSDNG